MAAYYLLKSAMSRRALMAENAIDVLTLASHFIIIKLNYGKEVVDRISFFEIVSTAFFVFKSSF